MFAQTADSLAGKKVVFVGDSITQGGGYIAFTSYYLEKLHPQKDFDIYGLGLSSDLHSAMRRARDARTEPFSRDRVHPGDEGHLLMARTILSALDVQVPEETVAAIKGDPLFKLIDQKRRSRSAHWMKHIGYTREKTVLPQPLGTIEEEMAKIQEEIDALRRQESRPGRESGADPPAARR